jgi:hypothetical protein
MLNAVFAAFCVSLVGCASPEVDYAPLTHTASLKNIGRQRVFDAVLFFGPSRYKMGVVPPGVAKHISRTGGEIPADASAEWRRADGSVHSGKVSIEKPSRLDVKERYIIQIDDENRISLSVEVPEPSMNVDRQTQDPSTRLP